MSSSSWLIAGSYRALLARGAGVAGAGRAEALISQRHHLRPIADQQSYQKASASMRPADALAGRGGVSSSNAESGNDRANGREMAESPTSRHALSGYRNRKNEASWRAHGVAAVKRRIVNAN